MKSNLLFSCFYCSLLWVLAPAGIQAQSASGPARPSTPERTTTAAATASASPAATVEDTETEKRQRSNLKIVFKGLRNDKGWLGMLLFNGPEGYPGEYRKAYKLAYKRIENGAVVIDFKDIPFGSYAVTMLHDENANMDIDFNFIGIPKEGYGASNNAARYFGPPRYKDARFEVNQTDQVITIKPIYW
jgi:uncharacterized protein (DUF2141 family)